MDKFLKMTGFATSIIDWYNLNKRDLPWRQNVSPYHVWISEIILQQTQVKQGLDYYNRFISLFPDVVSLANASEQEVLLAWQGLGYYSRARNLHAAAHQIVERHNGVMPNTYAELISLSGIGPYTAAAIASIAFGEPHAVVDGNVFRLLARCFSVELPIDTGEGKRFFTNLANELLDSTNPGDFNQAMMELGALVCTPANPDCAVCPLRTMCNSYRLGNPFSFPVKSRKTIKRDRYFYYFVHEGDKQLAITRREKGDIWQGLWELLLIESDKRLSENQIVRQLSESLNIAPLAVSHVVEMRHLLTHQNIFASLYKVKMPEKFNLVTFKDKKVVYTGRENLTDYPLPKLIEKLLAQYFDLPPKVL